MTSFLTRLYRLNQREELVIKRMADLHRVATDLELQRIQLWDEWERIEKAAKLVEEREQRLDAVEARLDEVLRVPADPEVDRIHAHALGVSL